MPQQTEYPTHVPGNAKSPPQPEGDPTTRKAVNHIGRTESLRSSQPQGKKPG